MIQLDRRTRFSRGTCALLLLGAIVGTACNEYDPSKRTSASGGATSIGDSQASGGNGATDTTSAILEEPSSANSYSNGDMGGTGAIGIDAGGALGSSTNGVTMAGSNAGGASAGTAATSGGVAGTNAVNAAVAGRASFHVFLLLGQSNMAGNTKAQAADRVSDPRIKVLGYDNCSATGRQIDQWATATPPLHACWTDAIGPGDYFAKTVIASLPSNETIGLVPCAISGERIETFLKTTGTQYSWIVSRAKLAQQAGGVIEGILFHQGESNNGDSTWLGKVSTLVTDLRTDLGLGNIPFLAGELLYSGSAAGHNTLIAKLPSVVTNAYVISADGLVVDPVDTEWKLHFDRDSQVTLGKRYAQKMLEVLKW